MANTEQTQQHLWTLSPNVVPRCLFLFLQVIYVYYGFRFCVFTEFLCANMYARVYLCLLTFLLGFSPFFLIPFPICFHLIIPPLDAHFLRREAA